MTDITGFQWTEKRSRVAILLAQGHTIRETSEQTGYSTRTIDRYKANPEFAAEVDRLSLMYGLSSKAERLRLIQRAARQFVHDDGSLDTGGDTLLDYLREARMTIDGTRLNIVSELAAISKETGSLARDRPGRGASLPDEAEDPSQ